jgi:hypothetical protein
MFTEVSDESTANFLKVEEYAEQATSKIQAMLWWT